MKLEAVVIGGFEPFFYGIMRSVFSIMAKRSVCSTEEVIPYHIPNSVVGFGFGVSIGVGLGTSLNFHQRCLEVPVKWRIPSNRLLFMDSAARN
jgi:hypothetical protein